MLVETSDGALLTRRYQRQYMREVVGLVFVDSSHEEMQWREAAIAPQFEPNWNNPSFLRENGFLPNHQKLTWRADIPLIVLERSEKASLSAFQGLTQQQVDAINAQWHDYQIAFEVRAAQGSFQLRSSYVPGPTRCDRRCHKGGSKASSLRRSQINPPTMLGESACVDHSRQFLLLPSRHIAFPARNPSANVIRQ